MADFLIFWAVCGYILGSIPFGLVITRAMGLGDLRQIGSGNIGATNVLRTGSKPAALATLLLDSGKGAIAVLVARAVAGEDAALVAGVAAFLGHLYPVWLGFRGGKGMATFLGTLLAMFWPLGLIACGIWLIVAVLGRMSSLASMISASATPLVAALLGQQKLAVACLVMAALILWRHRANIARIRQGNEPKIGGKG